MRYELDENSYIVNVYFNCHSGTCTEYSGTIPDGYETLEEWAKNANIRAYKIVDGNLVFDESRNAELLDIFKQEEIDNSFVCHKELYGLQQQIEDIQDVSNSQYVKETATGNVVLINNAKKSFPRIKITNVDPYKFNKVDLIVTGKNMLFNDATTQTISGIEFKQNADRSITINGTSTEDIEYTIGGTSSNTSPFLCLKKGLDYYLSSNNHQIKMYNYDGTDRTEVYSGKGGIINFTDEDKPVTQIVLCISKGKTIEDETVYPQLEFGDVASEYETYKSNSCQIDFSEYIEENPLYPSDLNIKHSVLKTGTTKSGVSKALNEVLETTEPLYPSDDLYPSGTSIDYILIESGKVKAIINSEEINLGTSSLCLFDGIDTIHTIQDTDVEIEYSINILDVNSLAFLQGKETTSGQFKLLEDGRFEASGGIIKGGKLTLDDNGTPDAAALIIRTELDPEVQTSDNGVTTVLGNRFEIRGEGIFEGDEQYISGYLHSGIASFSVTGDVWANSFENMSLLEKKKNITPFENGLELIRNADLYNFNYKNESDEHKKHIGLIINEDYNTPNEVISDGEKSIDIYSMISVAWQSIKELNNKIEELETKIKEMEEKQYEKNII